MNLLSVTSECAPFVKTGGLADVAGALPKALGGIGIAARTLLPAYPALQPLIARAKKVAHFTDLPGGPGRVFSLTAEGIDLLLLDAPQLFDRPGLPYTDQQGRDWPDNHLRFGALSQAAARIATGAIKGWRPDVVHAHDWQAGLVPVYLRMAETAPPSMLTIHNIAFQGRFAASTIGALGLPRDWFHRDGLEYWGDVGFLKSGIVYADRVTTVSPTYAREILTPEFGVGLDGVLDARAGKLSGILNGIDTDVWNPETDPALAQTYSARSLARRKVNRAALADRFGLAASDGPLFCVISRLTGQKGLDCLPEAIPHLVARGAQLAVLGSGEAEIETALRSAADTHKGAVGVVIGYDEPLSHLMQGGSDAILIPSRFEPCGLTQLYGLRYGTLPVVARTGGLADTVIDANPAAIAAGAATGFVMGEVSARGLRTVIDRVCDAHADPALWQAMQRAAMRQDVSWAASAETYATLYRDMLG